MLIYFPYNLYYEYWIHRLSADLCFLRRLVHINETQDWSVPKLLYISEYIIHMPNPWTPEGERRIEFQANDIELPFIPIRLWM